MSSAWLEILNNASPPTNLEARTHPLLKFVNTFVFAKSQMSRRIV